MTPLVSTMLPGLESGNFEKTSKKIPGHLPGHWDTQFLDHSLSSPTIMKTIMCSIASTLYTEKAFIRAE
jgi:hypothetical protein